MGVLNRFIGAAAGLGVVGALTTALKLSNRAIAKLEAQEAAERRKKKKKENAEKERERLASEFSFGEVCSEKDFQRLAEWAAYRVRGLEIIYFDGPVIHCRVTGSNGKSWCFVSDFNDFGKLSGLWWTTSDHETSTIPEYFSGLMEEKIYSIIKGKRPSFLDKPYDPKKDKVKPIGDEELVLIEAKAKVRAKKLKKFRKNLKYYIPAAIAVLVLCGFIAGYFVSRHNDSLKLKALPVSSYELAGMDAGEAEDILRAAGFTNIELTELEDLKYSDLALRGTVEYVSIKGDKSFSAGDSCPYDRLIRIAVHSPALAAPPIYNSGVKGKDRSDVSKLFSDAGFGDIRLQAEPDLVKGWLTKENTVKSIEINGSADYKTGVKFPVDSEIVIIYHTFK